MKNTIWVLVFLIILIVLLLFTYQAFKGDMESLFLAKPTKIEVTHNVVLKEIESLGKLELVKYKFKDIVEHKITYTILPNSKAVLIIAGEVVACMDLGKVQLSHIEEKGDTLTIQLPKPEICYSKINHQESKVYDTQYTYFQEGKMIDEAYKIAEKQLKLVALQSDILAQAEKNAKQLLKPLFERISNKKVVFNIPKQ